MVDKQIDPLEQHLRRTLHAHLDPLSKDRAAHAASGEASAVLARMRAQTMRRLPLHFSGVAAAILFILVMFVGVPQLLPERNELKPSQVPAPSQTGTAGPLPTATAPGLTPTASERNPTAPGRILYRAPANGAAGLFLTDENGANPVNLTHPGEAVTAFTWSPDGEWIAYSRSINNQEDILVMDASGGQVTQLTNAPGMIWRELAWSSHGEWIAATGARADRPEMTWLYLVPLNGGGAQKLFSWTGAHSIAWSPTQRDYLLFSSPSLPGVPEMMIHIVTQMGVIINITPPANSALFPGRDGPYAWSPNGTLAYMIQGPIQGDGTFSDNARAQLLVRTPENLQGENAAPTVLINDLAPGSVQSISWSPDGKTMAMMVPGEQKDCLKLAFVDASQVGKMVPIPEFCLKETNVPAWTQDGRLLLVDHTASRNDFVPRMVILSAAEALASPGNEHFTTRSIDSAAQSLTVQPRGKSLGLKPKSAQAQAKILPPSPVDQAPGNLWLTTYDNGTNDGSSGRYAVYTSRPNGSGMNLRSTIPLFGSSGSLSPDDSQVAFLSWGKDFPSLVIAQLNDQTTPQQLALVPTTNPVWSRDGKQLALLTSSGKNQGEFDQLSLVEVNASQSRVRTISLEGIARPQAVAWSPDGTRIALAMSTSKTSGSYWPYLYLLDLQKSTEHQPNLTQLTQSLDGGIYDLAWSPDGRQIAYLSHDEDYRTTELRLVNSDGSGNRTLARPAFLNPRSMGYTRLAWSPDGRYLSFITFEEAGGIAIETHVTLADIQNGKTYVLAKSGDEQITDTAWSPDGRWLVYKSDEGVFVMDVPGALSGKYGAVRVSDMTNVDVVAWRP